MKINFLKIILYVSVVSLTLSLKIKQEKYSSVKSSDDLQKREVDK